MKSIFLTFTFAMLFSFSTFAANRCFVAASRIAQGSVVPGTMLASVKHEPYSDLRIEKYVATLKNIKNPSQAGYLAIVLSAKDCSEIAVIPSF